MYEFEAALLTSSNENIPNKSEHSSTEQINGKENDVWELLEPKDIHSKISPSLYAKLTNEKWKVRLEGLEFLFGILNDCKRLADDSRHKQLITSLVKILGSDSNIMCASLAAKCLYLIAQGLRSGFFQYSAGLAVVCFDKFKEKKAMLREPLSILVDALFFASIKNLHVITPYILEFAVKPNPSQKSQLDLALYRLFRSLPSKYLPKGFLKELVPILCEHCLGSDPEVRDSSSAALGALQKCVGEQLLATFLINSVITDEKKMTKIRKFKDKAEEEDAELRKQAALLTSSNENIPNKSEHSSTEQINGKENDVWELLEPKDIHSKISPSLYAKLTNEKWKVRLEGLEFLFGILNDCKRLADDSRHKQLITSLVKILGSDSNIMCASLAAKCLYLIAQGLRSGFFQYSAGLAVVCFDKFKEKKAMLREPLSILVDALFFASIKNLHVITPYILEFAVKPNPSQKSQLDLALYRLFRSLPSKYLPKGFLKELVPILCEHCLGSDPEVRDSSSAALGALQKCVGEQILATFLTNTVITDERKMAKIGEYYQKVKDIPNIYLPSSNVTNDNPELQQNSKTSTSMETPTDLPNKPLINNKTKIIKQNAKDKNVRPTTSLTQRTSSNINSASINNNKTPRPISVINSRQLCFRPVTAPPPPMTPITKNTMCFAYPNTPSGSRIPRITNLKK
uniref:TOG domain-containing protein n=1 Tax=Meloidogyne hapla TaxID=6305 RepID=A0A1I8AYZ0_MELHA